MTKQQIVDAETGQVFTVEQVGEAEWQGTTMSIPLKHPLGSPASCDKRQYVRIRDYYTGETIYLADALHDGWEIEVQRYLGYLADIEEVETDDGFTLITADGSSVGYIGDHPDLPMHSQQAAE